MPKNESKNLRSRKSLVSAKVFKIEYLDKSIDTIDHLLIKTFKGGCQQASLINKKTKETIIGPVWIHRRELSILNDFSKGTDTIVWIRQGRISESDLFQNRKSAELQKIGEKIYGKTWKAALAHDLKISPRILIHYIECTHIIRRSFWESLKEVLIKKQQNVLKEIEKVNELSEMADI